MTYPIICIGYRMTPKEMAKTIYNLPRFDCDCDNLDPEMNEKFCRYCGKRVIGKNVVKSEFEKDYIKSADFDSLKSMPDYAIYGSLVGQFHVGSKYGTTGFAELADKSELDAWLDSKGLEVSGKFGVHFWAAD